MPDAYTYSPDEIDRTLRSWSAWSSRAEGIGSSVPDAHRSGKGHRYDPLVHADRCADVERAMVFALTRWSIQWITVDHVMRGYTLRQVAAALSLRSDVVRRGYDEGCEAMARYLGWVPPISGD